MHSLEVLEFDSVRGLLQAHCETALAGSQAADLAPSFDESEVWRLLSLTEEAHAALSRQAPPSLWAVKDLRMALDRAAKGGALGGQEVFAIGDAASTMRALKSYLLPLRGERPGIGAYAEALPDLKRLEERILASVESDGSVNDAASPTLAGIRQKKRAAAGKVLERIQSYISGRARELLSDPIYTIRDGRYVLPLKAENRGKIRGIVHDVSGSGQTVYVEPEDVLQLGNALRALEAAESQEELKVLAELSALIGAVASDLKGGIEATAAVDLLFAKARMAFAMKASAPRREGRHRIAIQQGRHPLLEGEGVVPLTISVAESANVLITGPNTGGKTVAIKCVGLFVAMAQSGMMLPALDVRFGPFSQIWADIGDEQSLQQSLSTFSGHIRNVADALKNVEPGALVLLDEIGAGTDPAEGAALARAVLRELAKRGAAVLASTHYGELKAFAYSEEGFSNAAMEFDAKTLRPTYRLIMGAPGASHALKIAERYGIPRAVIEDAREGLGAQHQDIALMMEQLEVATRQARTAQGEADRKLAELKSEEQRASRKLAEAEEIRRSAHSKAQEVIDAALREIRLEASRIFDELKSSAGPKEQEAARRQLKDLQQVGQEFATELAPQPAGTKPDRHRLKKGTTVRIQGISQTGTVIDEPRGGSVAVRVGPLKMSVAVEKLQIVETRQAPAPRQTSNIRLQKAINASTEIHLRQMRAEDAQRELDRFLDDALLAGLPSVRIVHGKGEGILRKVTREVLREHSGVASFRDGEPAEGGHGVTIATLK